MSFTVVRGLQRNELGTDPRVVTDGSFDGVHIGHQSLLRETVRLAEERSAHATVVTYEPLPAAFFAPEGARRRLLTPLPERLALLERYGINTCVVLPFDGAFAALSAEAFVKDILRDGLQAIVLTAAEGHTVGAGARAGVTALGEIAEQFGIAARFIPPTYRVGERVSSTAIRSHLRAGEVGIAQALLGRYYHTAGRVVTGDHRGRGLGFPTANLDIAEEKLLPADGVYACHAAVSEEVVPRVEQAQAAVVNVGRSPTFGQMERRVEVHLLDFEGDLVGTTVHVFFVARLRGCELFATVSQLVAQIERDTQQARTLLADRSAGTSDGG